MEGGKAMGGWGCLQPLCEGYTSPAGNSLFRQKVTTPTTSARKKFPKLYTEKINSLKNDAPQQLGRQVVQHFA